MPTLLNFTHPDKAHWLTQPRYAVITWPLLLTPVTSMAGFGGVAIALFGIAVSGYTRLTWFKLLPREQSRLERAHKALHAASPAQAINALQEARWVGTHYQVKRAALLARAFCQQDDYSKAHQVLSALADKPLLPDEQLCQNIAWAQLLNAADNPAEARRRLAGISDQQCLEDLDCLLLKTDLVEFKRAPRADLTDIVHHNLAIALLKNDQPSQAKEVLCNQTNQETEQLIALLKNVAQQLQTHNTTIDAYLTNLSPKLIGPLLLWHRYRTDADKARIQLVNDPSSLQHAFTTLFNHLREKAEWLSEQGTAQQSIEAWLIICDEIVAYHDELQPEVQQR